METFMRIIRRKPMFFVLISIGYLVAVGLVKWSIHPTWGTVSFLGGGVLGIYFLDIAEEFFHLTPSPFRSIVFFVAFIIVSFFVITSSGSMLASGLVLSMYLTLLLWQLGEWQVKRNLNDWYRMIAGSVNDRTQVWIMIGCVFFFCVLTYFFIR